MAEHILVKTPLTSDGNLPVIGPDGKMVYSESILKNQPGPQGAKAILTKRNTFLPDVLKSIIEDYDGPLSVDIPVPETKKTKASATA